MSDFLGIDLIAGLNQEQSKLEIDRAIEKLSGKLDQLKVGLDIDDKALQTIKTFNTEMKKLVQTADKIEKAVNGAMNSSGTKDDRAIKLQETIKQIQQVEQAQKKQGDSAEKELKKESRQLSELLSQYTHLNKITNTRNEAGEITGKRYDVGDKYGDITGSIFANNQGEVIRDTFAENIEKNNRRLEKATRDREDIFRQLHDMENKYGDTANPKILQMFSEQAEKGTTDSLVDLKKNIAEYGKELSNMNADDKRLEGIVNTREGLYRKLTNIQQAYGDNVDPQKMRMFSQEIATADEKTLKKISTNVDDYEKSMAKLENVQNFQRDMLEKIEALEFSLVGKIKPEHKKHLEDLSESTLKLNQNTEGLKTKQKDLQRSFKGISREVIKADQGMVRFSGQLASAMIRVPIYAATMSAMYAPLKMFKDAINQIIEIDAQITVLKRVTNGVEDINSAMTSSIDIAKRLGNVISEVNEGLINFARQGYRGEDLTAMAEVATVMSNVSDLNVDEAASSLTASMKAFNIEAKDSIRIVDAMNEVDNTFSVTTEQLAQSIQKSAGSANTFGVSLEKLIGLTTAVAEISRESGNIIGNSWKTIFSRITTAPEAVSSLEGIGISIKDSMGNLRTAEDILDELGRKWNNLTREQQQNIGINVAGRHQLSRLLIAMENYDQVLSATDAALHSNGSAMRENEAYLESYEAKINQVKNAWTESTMALQEDVLGDVIVASTSIATSAIEVFTSVIDKVGLLPAVFGTAGIALALFNVNVNSLARKGLTNLGAGLKSVSESIYLTGLTARQNISSVGMFSASLQGLRAVLTTLWPMLTLMAAGWGISKLIGFYTQAKQRTEEWQKAQEKSLDSLYKEEQQISKLVEEYEKLDKLGDHNRNNTQEERYIQLQNELATLLPTVAQGEDAKGNAILANTEIVKNHIEVLKEQLQWEMEIARETALADITVNTKNIEKTEKKIEKLQKRIGENVSYQSEFVKEMKHGAPTDFLDNISNAIDRDQSKIEELRGDLDIFEDKLIKTYEIIAYGQSSSLSNEDYNWISQQAFEAGIATEKVEGYIENLTDRIVNLRKHLGEDLPFSFIANIDQLKALEEVSSSVDNGGEEWQKYADTLKEVGIESNQVNQILGYLQHTPQQIASAAREMGENVDATKPVFGELGKTIENFGTILLDGEEGLDSYGNEVDELSKRVSDASDDFEDLAEIIKELSEAGQFDTAITIMHKDAYKALSDEISPLNGLLETMAEGKSISAAEAMELINKEEGLAEAISIESGQVKINEEAVLSLRDAKLASYKTMQEAVLAEAEQVANATIANLKNYGIEIEAIKDLATAKQALADTPTVEGSSFGIASGEISNEAVLAGEKASKEISKLVGIYENIEQLEKMAGLTTQGLKEVGTSAEKTSKSSKKNAKDTKESTYIADSYALALDRVNLALEKQNSIQAKVAKHSKEYRDSLQKELKLLEQKSAIIKSQHDDLSKQIRSGYINQTGIVTNNVASGNSSSTASGSGTQATIWNFLSSKGFSDNIVAGIMGNLQLESNFNTSATNSSSGAFGLAQWLGSRKSSLQNYAKSRGTSASDLQTQLDFLWKELNSTEKRTLNWLQANQNASASTVAAQFDKLFERSEGTHIPQRQRYANQILKQYSGTASSGSTIDTSDISREIAQNAQNLDKAKSDLIGYELELLKLNDQIAEIPYQIVESHIAAFDHAMNQLESKMSRIDYYQTRYDEFSPEWSKYQFEREKLLEQQNKQHEASIKFIEKEIKSNKNLTKEQRKRLDDQLIERQSELWNLESRILDERIKVANQLMSVYKDALSAQKDAALSSIDKMIKEIDDMEKEADYKRKLKNEQSDRQEILDEISQWALNDSDMAKKRVKELTEQLQEIDEAIEDMQHQKGLDDRKNALEEQKERIGNQYDNLINDEQTFANMRSNIIKGNTKTIEKELNTFYKKLSGMTEELGNSVVKNLQRSISQMNSYIQSPNFDKVKVPHFNTGGLARVKSPAGGLAIVHDKEHIFKPDDTEILHKTVQLSKELFSHLKTPKLPQLATNSVVDSSTVYDIDLHIENMNGTQKDVDNFMNNIGKNVRKRGGRMRKM